MGDKHTRWECHCSPEAAERALGWLPEIIRGDDPRPVKEQINERYAHGGGFRGGLDGIKLETEQYTLSSGDDEEDYNSLPIAWARINNEWVGLYKHAVVMVMQDDGTYELTRMD